MLADTVKAHQPADCMQTISCPLNPASVEALEAFLAEDETCAWTIDLDARGGNPVLCGYFTDAAEGEAAYARLRQTFPQLPAHPRQGIIEDCVWQDAYKAYLHPWSHDKLHWVPVWLKEGYSLPDDAVAVYFDAGMAFGTGSHETTRLMARRLTEFKQARGREGFASARILDAGCGSGILAISAALLGCTQVSGFDCDPEAIRVSRENLTVNQLDANALNFYSADLSDGFCHGPYDCVMANIQADVLIAHVNPLMRSLASGGTLAMSGILTAELDSVKSCFEQWIARQDIGLISSNSRSDGEWADLCYTIAWQRR